MESVLLPMQNSSSSMVRTSEASKAMDSVYKDWKERYKGISDKPQKVNRDSVYKFFHEGESEKGYNLNMEQSDANAMTELVVELANAGFPLEDIKDFIVKQQREHEQFDWWGDNEVFVPYFENGKKLAWTRRAWTTPSPADLQRYKRVYMNDILGRFRDNPSKYRKLKRAAIRATRNMEDVSEGIDRGTLPFLNEVTDKIKARSELIPKTASKAKTNKK